MSYCCHLVFYGRHYSVYIKSASGCPELKLYRCCCHDVNLHALLSNDVDDTQSRKR